MSSFRAALAARGITFVVDTYQLGRFEGGVFVPVGEQTALVVVR